VISEQFAIAIDRSHAIDKVIIANSQLLEKTLELRKTLKEEKRIRQMQSEFVAMVSHEFKTPLQIIDSTRELVSIKLKKFSIEDLSVDKYLIKIKNAISRMNSLIQSSLNLAKIEMNEGGIEAEMNDFGIKNLITEIIEKNSTLASEKNIQIITELNDLPEFYKGDAKLLDHCFTNVITNAIKYSKNNFPVKIIGGQDGKNIFVKVIDSGIGIPKEDIANVGRKFFRAKNTLAVSGTGIGLFLTKHFVELHNGSVNIESTLDVGTTATITLPIIKK
jgi:signal transduction histidine kinase